MKRKLLAWGPIVLILLIVGSLVARTVQSRTRQLSEAYEKRITELQERLREKERELTEARSTQSAIKETIVERKRDGTVKTTKRETATVTKSETKTVESEREKETSTKTSTDTGTKKEASTTSGRSRLGLDVSFGAVVSTGLGLHWQTDVSYDVGLWLVPRVGVQFAPTFAGGPTAYTLGVELQL